MSEASGKGFFAAAIEDLAFNVKSVKRRAVFDASCFIAPCLLFAANDLVLIPYLAQTVPGSLAHVLVSGHLNDFLGGLSFLAYANLLLDAVRPDVRIGSLFAALAFILLCGLFWEYAAPLFVEGSVSDPIDLAAYAAGAFVYYLLNRFFSNSVPN